MSYINNLLNPGSYTMIEPIGLHLAITYNKYGAIESVSRYTSDTSTTPLPNELFDIILKNHILPRTIMLKGGTTTVTGVLYSGTQLYTIGQLPLDASDELMKDFKKNYKKYKFTASTVESHAASFPSSMHVKQWLTLNKFNATDGILIPSDLTDQRIGEILSQLSCYNINNIYGCIVSYSGSEYTRKFTNIVQDKVMSITQYSDDYGRIYADMKLSKYEINGQVNWSTLYTHNIRQNKLIMLDPENMQTILNSKYEDKRNHRQVDDTIVCPVCKKLIKLRHHAPTLCDDPKCSSLQYHRINQYLKAVKLNELSKEDFIKLSKKNDQLKIIDVLRSEIYDSPMIITTLSKQLEGFIPKTIMPNKAYIQHLCDKCNNAQLTLFYYLKNEDKAYIDLSLNRHIYKQLFYFINKDNNLDELVELLSSGMITTISQSAIKQNAPIFRDKLIFITGTFRHGSYNTIKEIIESYSGKVTYEFTPHCDCALTGDLLENIDGHAIKNALKLKIPVIAETEFFNKYDIDSDLK